MQAFGLLFLSVIIEGTITYLKTFFVEGKFQWQMLLGLGLGILTASAFQIDLFEMVGMQSSIPYLGNILTGLLISRGSNYTFDLISRFNKIPNDAKPNPPADSPARQFENH